ncbi:MAG: hypothetical protein ACI4R6_01060 [Lachnospiraceae bacterium]
MKKWNAPEIAELNITETANGIFKADIETQILFKNNDNTLKPGDEPNDDANSLS